MFIQASEDTNKTNAALFSPFWNEIINSLREEDYISNRYIIDAYLINFLLAQEDKYSVIAFIFWSKPLLDPLCVCHSYMY